MSTIFDLERFIVAQENNYYIALKEIAAGKKQTHWVWYIFPTIANRFAFTEYNFKYSISNIEEAIQYYNHPLLGARLIEITSILYNLKNQTIEEVFPKPDIKKLKASMSLFYMASNKNELFKNVLNKYFNGEFDIETINSI